MSTEFALWAACHRIYSQMPTLVSDERGIGGGGRVRFMLSLQGADGESLESVYDEENLLATGYEDDDRTVHLMAVADDFMAAPCVLVVRTAISYVDSTAVTEVTVLLDNHSEDRFVAIEQVRDMAHADHFENLLKEREHEKSCSMQAEPENTQGRSLLDRWFGKP